MEVTLTVGSQRESRESNVIEPIRKAGRQSSINHQLPRIFWRHMSLFLNSTPVYSVPKPRYFSAYPIVNVSPESANTQIPLENGHHNCR